MPVKGIIFDMDNTLLQSRIDFAAMKRHIYEHLTDLRLLGADFPLHEHTSATMIEHAREAGLTETGYTEVMGIAAQHELRGMEGAGLEPGARELLETLRGTYTLAVVTNNSCIAAVKALQLTGIEDRFGLIAGREQMTALKPSPSGFLHVLEQFPHIRREEWISVGDSWIDGKGSIGAGLAFISYKTGMDVMRSKGVEPAGRIDALEELTAWLAAWEDLR
ncbi:phosphoglycolate phosphatase [Paenibacillus sp. UNCCL117]|uniref:HAD family hydrolase n=1 Tax=unclassified Paenibacillus TaxID=185978 RepID=UPI000881C3EA|nr:MULTISPECIES: HAD-IA family hydrolase [unclassified Paenibacillus]SDD70610.1 phosphoglycolate phosphatase [Paenibacillus sp. cl123]SFW45378.1 phosphoglycolate phosphatase [Paenibacillus sp. UNCCL117]